MVKVVLHMKQLILTEAVGFLKTWIRRYSYSYHIGKMYGSVEKYALSI